MATVAVSQCTKQSDYATSTASYRFACNVVSTTSRHLSHTSSSTSGLQPRWLSYAMPSSNRPRPHTSERPASYARNNMNISITRHRASTSMSSLTFWVRFLLPERHQRKPAVQAAAVMLRTPTVTRQSAASSARRPHPAGRSHYVVISQACN